MNTCDRCGCNEVKVHLTMDESSKRLCNNCYNELMSDELEVELEPLIETFSLKDYQFYKVKYVRLPDLIEELAIARGQGTFQKTIKQYKKVDLLILDEWLLSPLESGQERDLLEIIESRHQASSTIFCSQFAPEGWYERIGESTIADAIMDRIVHDSYTLFIDDKVSMRERHGLNKEV